MTVIVAPPNQADTRSAMADWLELQALRSSRGNASKGTLINVLDIVEDEAIESPRLDEETGEPLDEAILEDERAELITAVFEELQYRADKLLSAYPFAVDASRSIITRRRGKLLKHPGQVVYLFCLLVSAIREKKVQPDKSVAQVTQAIADTFQICACLAAGGYVNGEVSSFGFPRATGTAFLPALRSAFARFGVGEVRSEPPDGLPESLKDGGIDVIAWRDHPDGMPGKIYVLGQCASGDKWKEKSVVEYIPQLHGSWFSTSPAEHSLPAMFIPFTCYRDLTEVRQGTFAAAVKNRYWHEEQRFGMIFDRVRIAFFADSCMRLESKLRKRVDGTERFNHVKRWVTSTCKLLGVSA
jgi:hypothetical protein